MLSITPEATQAILIGTSEFIAPELHPLPSVKRNVEELAKLLISPLVLGIPEDNVTKIINESNLSKVKETLRKKSEEATDTLIFYYAGHGLIDPSNSNALLLSFQETQQDDPSSALSWNEVSEAVRNSTAIKKIIIVDSCYSGRIHENETEIIKPNDIADIADIAKMARDTAKIISDNPREIMASNINSIGTQRDNIHGTYTIASVAENQKALAPSGAEYTAFSGVLINTIKTGIDNQESYITVDTLFKSIENQLSESSFPRPIKSIYRDGDKIKIFRNPIRPIPSKYIFVGNAKDPTVEKYRRATKKYIKKLFPSASVLDRQEYYNFYCNGIEPTPEISAHVVKNCEAYVALIGTFYGKVYEAEKISHTEYELRVAQEEKKKTIVFVLGEDKHVTVNVDVFRSEELWIKKQDTLKQNLIKQFEGENSEFQVYSPNNIKQLKTKLREFWNIPPEPHPLKLIFAAVLGAIVTTGVGVFLFYYLLHKPSTTPRDSYSACSNLPERLTCGGDLDFLSTIRSGPLGESEKEGTMAFETKDYTKAVEKLESAWKEDPDPYTLIALNNAKVLKEIENGEIQQDNVFRIAVSSLLYKELEFIGKNIIAGVALRQDEINRKFRLNKDPVLRDDFRLIVVMADDSNDKDRVKERAREIINTKNILGVIAPYSSHATYYVIDDYFNNLALVSATSTASLDAYQQVHEEKELDFSWFFRSVPTTTRAAEDLASYLKNDGCKNKSGCEKIILIHRDDKLFAKSFYQDFITIAKEQKYNLEILLNQNYKTKPGLEKIKRKIDDVKQNGSPEKTALVLVADAYTTQGSASKMEEIIEYNQGELFIAGNNILHDPNVLELVKEDNALANMVISVPWFSPEKFADADKNLASKLDSELELSWHMAMSYDATQMLVEAILIQLLDNRTPDRKGTRDALASPNFKTEGLTGTIMLDGSDRQVQFSTLIYPHCSQESCEWRKIESPERETN